MIILIPTIVVIGMIVFVNTAFFASNQALLSKALTFDLLIALPLIHYLQVRKNPISKYSVFKLFGLCLLIATFIIPEDHQQVIAIIKPLFFPLAKLLVGIIVFHKVSVLNRTHKRHSKYLSGYDLYKTTCLDSFPGRFGELLSMEIGVVYFLVKKQRQTNYVDNEYGYQTNKGTVEMISGFIFIIAIETIVGHYLIYKWSPFIAYLSSYGSIYLIVLFISILKSRSHFPIILDPIEKKLNLNYGFINSSTINIQDIQSIELSSKSNLAGLMKLSAFKGVENHNIIIHFDKNQTITKVFGIKKTYDKIGLFLDQPEKFIQNLKLLLGKQYGT